MRRAALTILVLLGACWLGACSGGGTTSSGDGTSSSPSTTASSSATQTTGASTAALTIVGGAYDSDLVVEPGAAITVRNAATFSHNVVAEDGSFRTPTTPADDEATFTAPTEPGEYPFVCTLQPGMRAMLNVPSPSTSPDSSPGGTTSGEHPPPTSRPTPSAPAPCSGRY